jgi:2'-hydroxyisoflavone reductase
MKLLILGGTGFLGRHLVTAALAKGHELTLFNRGISGSGPNHVETIVGDRMTDLSNLDGRSWDAVIDTSGFLPRAVKTVAELLAPRIASYVFISSVSAYADLSVANFDETAALATLTSEELDAANQIDGSGPASGSKYGKLYGGLKALCETAAHEALPGRVLIMRPGLIVGPEDYTDRFTYWPARVDRGGEVLAPGSPDRHVQFIDARDLAEWIMRMIETNQTGTYNACGLPGTLTMKSLLEGCKSVSGSNANFTWVNDEFLSRSNVMGWSEVPLWVPQGATHLRGMMTMNCDKAVAAGLTFRLLRETIQDTLRWYKASRPNGTLAAGIDPGKERALLSRWHEEKSPAITS